MFYKPDNQKTVYASFLLMPHLIFELPTDAHFVFYLMKTYFLHFYSVSFMCVSTLYLTIFSLDCKEAFRFNPTLVLFNFLFT